jgi:hypothetical protein
MRTQCHDVRCKRCGILLARLDETGLTIKRNDLEARFEGRFRASIRCYRRSCGELNSLRFDTSSDPTWAAA